MTQLARQAPPFSAGKDSEVPRAQAPMQKTYKFRLRDTADSELRRQAKACNFVWNFCREAQEHSLRWRKRWPSKYDLQKLTAGSSKELNIHAHTIQQICERYTRSRDQHRKPLLRWRGKRSLGWVPFNTGHVVYRDGGLWFRGRKYKAWVSRELKEGQRFGAGSFSQDSLGNWYINLPVKVEEPRSNGKSAVGIDLGLKDIASLSDGSKIENPRWYRNAQERLGKAQRANKKRLARKIHAKIKNQRADYLHKESARLVEQHGAIFVGNVKPKAIAKTRMSKSSLDAGWAIFKRQLEYKANARHVLYAEVNEAFTSQICSNCGDKPESRPKGIADLGIRQWTCSSCGAEHDRDHNAAKNIVARGLASLAEGASE